MLALKSQIVQDEIGKQKIPAFGQGEKIRMGFESIGCRDFGLYTQGRSCRMTEVAEQFVMS